MNLRVTFRPDIPFVLAEIRYCSLLIGLIELSWSIIGQNPPASSIFARRMAEAGLGMEWSMSMALAGLILAAGSIFPWRSGRHIGLFLSAIIWFTMFGVFYDLALVTPVVISMPIFGLFSVGLMYADAKRKPRRREKLDT